MSAMEAAREICKYLGSGDKLITQDLMQSVTAISEIIARHEPDLSALRAAAAERDYLQRRVDSLQLTLNTIDKHNDELQRTVAELTQENEVDAMIIEGLNTAIRIKDAEIEAQAAQLEQALELIDQSCTDAMAISNMSDSYVSKMAEHLANQLGDWIAANAPVPEEERTICQCVCECDQVATKEDEHGTKLCEQCYNDYYGIAPQVTS